MAASASAMSALSTLRLSGMASGMDTESMVTSLMRVERMKYDKLAQQKTLMDWKSDANMEVNNLLRAFRDDYLSVLKPDKYMMNSSSVQIYKVAMDASQSIKVTAGKDALAGSHQIDSITSQAAGAHASSGAAMGTGLSLDATLATLATTTPLSFVNEELSFSINGQGFTFKSSDSLRTIINRVNSDTKANVVMSFSSLTGKLSVTSKDMGSDSSMVIKNGVGNAFLAGGSAFGIEEGTFANGSDAVLKIDGVDVVKDTNAFTIDGVNYTLTGTSATPIKFTVEQDIDAAVNKVKGFVDAYNTLIAKLDDKLTEKKNPDYLPLTEDQRSSMSATQIEQWEKLAKSGLLNGDGYVKKLVQDLRKSFYDNVAGAGASASMIGLNTMSYLTKGTIQVDEAKLRKALQDNPQQVAQVLSNVSNSASPATKYSESGLAARIQTSLNSFVNDSTGYRQSSFNALYSRIETNMTNMATTLKDKEERYWAQFTRMETALSKMNSQSSWLSQQLGAQSSQG